MRTRAAFISAALLLVAAGCARGDAGDFSIANARRHVGVLAHDIGSRPAGTEANDRARAYLVDQLRALGFDVRVQAADARRPEAGISARVQNIIAIREGQQRDAIALVAHYDSVPYGPGGADDGLGAAVCVEAARALVSQRPPAHTLAIILTDAEEPPSCCSRRGPATSGLSTRGRKPRPNRRERRSVTRSTAGCRTTRISRS
jgi:hypothetical protein